LAGTQNLISLGSRPEAERKRIASEGGKASGVAKRKKKMLSQYLTEAINSPILNPQVLDRVVSNFEIKDEADLTYNAGVAVGIIDSAMKRKYGCSKTD